MLLSWQIALRTRTLIQNMYPPPARNSTIQQTLRKVSLKIKAKDLALVKADKGGMLALLTRAQYDKKMHELLLSSGARLSNASLKTYNAHIRALIKASTHVLAGSDN